MEFFSGEIFGDIEDTIFRMFTNIDELAVELMHHEVLHKYNVLGGEDCIQAYNEIAERFGLLSWRHAHGIIRAFRRYLALRLIAMLRAGYDFNNLPYEPFWLRPLEAKLHMIPKLLTIFTFDHENVVLSLCKNTAKFRNAEDVRVLRATIEECGLVISEKDLAQVWWKIQVMAMRAVKYSWRGGDGRDVSAPALSMHVADHYLLYGNLNRCHTVDDYERWDATVMESMLFIWELVKHHHLEDAGPPRSRERALRWTRAFIDYRITTGRYTSIVILQRRWFEAKLIIRAHILSQWPDGREMWGENAVDDAEPLRNFLATGEVSPPFMVEVAEMYPDIVIGPLSFWVSDVYGGDVVTEELSEADMDRPLERPLYKPSLYYYPEDDDSDNTDEESSSEHEDSLYTSDSFFASDVNTDVDSDEEETPTVRALIRLVLKPTLNVSLKMEVCNVGTIEITATTECEASTNLASIYQPPPRRAPASKYMMAMAKGALPEVTITKSRMTRPQRAASAPMTPRPSATAIYIARSGVSSIEVSATPPIHAHTPFRSLPAIHEEDELEMPEEGHAEEWEKEEVEEDEEWEEEEGEEDEEWEEEEGEEDDVWEDAEDMENEGGEENIDE